MGIIQVPVAAVIMYLEAIRFQAENWPKPIGLRLSKKTFSLSLILLQSVYPKKTKKL
jgi:hypothetical protein